MKYDSQWILSKYYFVILKQTQNFYLVVAAERLVVPVAEPIAALAVVQQLDEPVVVLELLEEYEGMQVQEKLDDPETMPQQDSRFPELYVIRI